jgi:3-hydroxyisobutyrate dehydrogenase-like beta-hydroxyacid dehydrogenase
MFKLKGPSMIDGKYTTAFALKHQQKDMRLALALGDEVAQSMPVAAAANEVKCFQNFTIELRNPLFNPSAEELL